MKEDRKEISKYSSSELIAMARKSIANGELGNDTFKEVNNVDFTFMQLCSSLARRRYGRKEIMTYEEYGYVKDGMVKAELNSLFLGIQQRYEKYLLDERNSI